MKINAESIIFSLKPFSPAGLGLAPRRREHERNLHQRSAIGLKGVDNDDDIYIMMQCLSVCVSRKMIT